MRINNHENDPIEMLRLSNKMTQKEFAKKIGYSKKYQYRYNFKNFTKDVIDKIKNEYDFDITMDIIKHLKTKIRGLERKIATKKKFEEDSDTASNIREIANKII